MAKAVVGVTFRHVFVIGAMKSGTTTLHADFSQHPDVSVAEKEYDGLRRFDTASDTGRRAYRDGLGDGELTVDITASYSMAPHLSGVACDAAAVEPRAAVVYLVRDPVARIVSHHHHDLASGIVPAEIDTAVRKDPRLIDYSRYAAQLRPWFGAFPASSIRVVKFEDYVEDRRGTTDELLGWLGLRPLPAGADIDSVSNRTRGRVAARGRLRGWLHSDLYRHRIRPLVPQRVRSRTARAVLTTTPARPAPPSAETVRHILSELASDLRSLHDTTGVGWDVEEIARRASGRDTAGGPSR